VTGKTERVSGEDRNYIKSQLIFKYIRFLTVFEKINYITILVISAEIPCTGISYLYIYSLVISNGLKPSLLFKI